MTSVEYITTFADYKAAQSLHLRCRRGARLRFRLWMFGLPVATILLLADAQWQYQVRGFHNPGTFVLAAYSLVITILVVVLRPWNLKRLYRKNRKTAGVEHLDTVQFGFDDTLVRSGYPGRSEGQFQWSSIVDYGENDKIFLLYISKKMFLYIPKRAMTNDQWQDLRDLLARNGKMAAC